MDRLRLAIELGRECSLSPCSPAAMSFEMPMFVPSANSASSSRLRSCSRGMFSRVVIVVNSLVKARVSRHPIPPVGGVPAQDADVHWTALTPPRTPRR